MKKEQDYSLNENGTLTITGVASTTNQDLQDETITSEALKSMLNQAPDLNLHVDHEYHLDGVLGSIKEAKLNNGVLNIKAIIRKKYASDIKEMLDLGIKLGLSIGGIPVMSKNNNNEITDINLLEISLTPMPANWDTMGTVETSKNNLVESNCLNGACKYIKKKFEVKNMSETDNETKEVISLTKEEAVILFNELMAEKEETIVTEVINNVKTEKIIIYNFSRRINS